MKFSDFFNEYLERTKNKDFKIIEETVHKEVPLRALLPLRELVTKHSEFLNIQQDYFNGSSTNLEYEVLTTEECGELAFGACVIKVTVHESKVLNEFKRQICFIFKKYKGHWVLTFNQNTDLNTIDHSLSHNQ